MRKNILFIGGSHGIGLAAAKLLAEDTNLIIASRTANELQNLDITHIPFDVTKDDIHAIDLPETLDGLVFYPGSINLKPFKMLSQDIFEHEMGLNFFSLVKVVRDLLPKLKESKQASLVFFSTVAVKVGMPYHTSIAASKGAIEGFAKSLAAEYAPTFRVNVISPSLTDTPLSEKLLSNEAKREKMGDRHPLKRVGNPEDIANAVSFLLSDKSSWMTGQIIGIDGGLSTLNVN